MRRFTTKRVHFCGFTTSSETQHKSLLLCLSSAGGAKARRAFTLIETMIAITILTLSVAGPLYTANRAIVAAQIARDQLIASSLAQEGIECVRTVRDDDFLTAYQNQVNGNNDSNVSGTGWNAFVASPKGGCEPIAHPEATDTAFTRTITATALSGTEERIQSRVSWSFHGSTYAVTIVDNLTQWQ